MTLRDCRDIDRSRPVICAIDFDDLAPQLISAARTLAHRAGADVRVVHVVTPAAGDSRSDGPTRSRRLLLPPQPRRSQVVEAEELGHRLADAEAMMLRLGVAAEERLVLQGDAVLETQTIATRLEAAMLVIGWLGGAGVDGAQPLPGGGGALGPRMTASSVAFASRIAAGRGHLCPPLVAASTSFQMG